MWNRFVRSIGRREVTMVKAYFEEVSRMMAFVTGAFLAMFAMMFRDANPIPGDVPHKIWVLSSLGCIYLFAGWIRSEQKGKTGLSYWAYEGFDLCIGLLAGFLFALQFLWMSLLVTIFLNPIPMMILGIVLPFGLSLLFRWCYLWAASDDSETREEMSLSYDGPPVTSS